MKKFLFLLTLVFGIVQWNSGFASCFSPSYTSFFGGVNYFDLNKHRELHLDKDAGYVGAFAIGYDIFLFRVEGEVSYRWNKISRHKSHYGYSHRHVDAHTDSLSWMVNGYYDFFKFFCVTSYIGLGAGYGNVKAHASSDHETNHKVRSNGYALQAIGGIKTRIWLGTDLGIEYRYHVIRDDVVDQSIGVKLSYEF